MFEKKTREMTEVKGEIERDRHRKKRQKSFYVKKRKKKRFQCHCII